MNRSDSVENLQHEIRELKEKIESSDDSLPIKLGFPRLLVELDEILDSENLDVEKLDRNAFGIFRLVTESYEFEQSSLGKQLLEIRKKIRNLRG